jgi:Domain of unknown function (DUF4326)
VSDKPRRVQRKRVKGWRLPPNTVYVGRPTKWGNPYGASAWGQAKATGMFCALLSDPRADSHRHEKHMRRILRDIHELRGKNLACWCPLDGPCHADALLKLAAEAEA